MEYLQRILDTQLTPAQALGLFTYIMCCVVYVTMLIKPEGIIEFMFGQWGLLFMALCDLFNKVQR